MRLTCVCVYVFVSLCTIMAVSVMSTWIVSSRQPPTPPHLQSLSDSGNKWVVIINGWMCGFDWMDDLVDGWMTWSLMDG